jgi:hypothetical protein
MRRLADISLNEVTILDPYGEKLVFARVERRADA